VDCARALLPLLQGKGNEGCSGRASAPPPIDLDGPGLAWDDIQSIGFALRASAEVGAIDNEVSVDDAAAGGDDDQAIVDALVTGYVGHSGVKHTHLHARRCEPSMHHNIHRQHRKT